MIRPTGSEFATNRSGLSGAAGEVRMFRMLNCPVSPIRAANPSTHAGSNISNGPSTAIPENPCKDLTPTQDKLDHSKPIGRTVVERFSPTRF
jgi:hypothetical protein